MDRSASQNGGEVGGAVMAKMAESVNKVRQSEVRAATALRDTFLGIKLYKLNKNTRLLNFSSLKYAFNNNFQDYNFPIS